MAKANRVAKAAPTKQTPGKVNRAGSNKKGNQAPQHTEFLFDKDNYMWMMIGVGVIILGFILMYGKEDIFSQVKITVAPILVISGFAIEVYAIMKKKKGEQPITESQAGENTEEASDNN